MAREPGIWMLRLGLQSHSQGLEHHSRNQSDQQKHFVDLEVTDQTRTACLLVDPASEHRQGPRPI